jgi:hypothetical protein
MRIPWVTRAVRKHFIGSSHCSITHIYVTRCVTS